MKRSIERLLPAAIGAVNDKLRAANGTVAKEYNGYIASFGAATIQMGLLPAIAVYADLAGGSSQDRKKLLEAMLEVLKDENARLPAKVKTAIEGKQGAAGMLNAALELVNNDNNNDLSLLKRPLRDASVALKLALRTYKLEKTKSDD